MDIDKLIYMELRKTQNIQDNVEEEDRSWKTHPRYQGLL